MDADQKEILKKCRRAIVNDLKVAPVLDYLLEVGVLEDVHYEQVRSNSRHEEQNRKFLEIIVQRQNDAYEHFLEALRRTGQHKILHTIQKPGANIPDRPHSTDPSQQILLAAETDPILSPQDQDASSKLKAFYKENGRIHWTRVSLTIAGVVLAISGLLAFLGFVWPGVLNSKTNKLPANVRESPPLRVEEFSYDAINDTSGRQPAHCDDFHRNDADPSQALCSSIGHTGTTPLLTINVVPIPLDTLILSSPTKFYFTFSQQPAHNTKPKCIVAASVIGTPLKAACCTYMALDTSVSYTECLHGNDRYTWPDTTSLDIVSVSFLSESDTLILVAQLDEKVYISRNGEPLSLALQKKPGGVTLSAISLNSSSIGLLIGYEREVKRMDLEAFICTNSTELSRSVEFKCDNVKELVDSIGSQGDIELGYIPNGGDPIFYRAHTIPGEIYLSTFPPIVRQVSFDRTVISEAVEDHLMTFDDRTYIIFYGNDQVLLGLTRFDVKWNEAVKMRRNDYLILLLTVFIWCYITLA